MRRIVATLFLTLAILVGVKTGAHAQTNVFDNQSVTYESLGKIYANRGAYTSAISSQFFYCRDCTIAVTCTGGGSGAWAWWSPALNNWACAGSLPSNLLTQTTTFAGDVVGAWNALQVQKWYGVALDSTTFTSPPNGSLPQYSAASGKWLAQTVATNVAGLQVSHNVYSGGNLPVTHSAAVSVLAVGLTMPSSGCPCRVLAAWNIAGTDGASLQLGGWVNDGTNSFAGAQSNTGASRGGTPGTGISPVTYANNAAVTMTLFSQTDSGTFTIKTSGAISANIPSYLDLMVFPSN